MALYHLNYESGEPERCEAMVSCPHGDLDTAHFISVQELRGQVGAMGASLATLALVRELTTCLDRAEAIEKVGTMGIVRREIAATSYALGRLAVEPADEDHERFRASLGKLQEALFLTLKTSSAATNVDVMVELVKATNLVAELGSASHRR